MITKEEFEKIHEINNALGWFNNINNIEKIRKYFSREVIYWINCDYISSSSFYSDVPLWINFIFPYISTIPIFRDKYNNKTSFTKLFECHLTQGPTIGSYFITAKKGTIGYSISLLASGICTKNNKIDNEFHNWSTLEQADKKDIVKALNDIDEIKEIINVNNLSLVIKEVNHIITLESI